MRQATAEERRGWFVSLLPVDRAARDHALCRSLKVFLVSKKNLQTPGSGLLPEFHFFCFEHGLRVDIKR
jgi:hypothetical protein